MRTRRVPEKVMQLHLDVGSTFLLLNKADRYEKNFAPAAANRETVGIFHLLLDNRQNNPVFINEAKTPLKFDTRAGCYHWMLEKWYVFLYGSENIYS